MATEPQPTSRHLLTQQREISVCGINSYSKMWEGGREKQARKLAEQTPAKAHGNASADLLDPPPDPGEWQHWLDFNFA